MQNFRGQTRCIMGDMPMENCGSKRNKGHTNEVSNPLSSFPFSFFFFFIFFTQNVLVEICALLLPLLL